jgi:hypothetical protein
LRLTSDYIKTVLGSTITDSANDYKLTNWLAQQEDKHRLVLYQCDYLMTNWTQRCIRQADCILIVGLGEREPSIGKVPRLLFIIQVILQINKFACGDVGGKAIGAFGFPYSKGACFTPQGRISP